MTAEPRAWRPGDLVAGRFEIGAAPDGAGGTLAVDRRDGAPVTLVVLEPAAGAERGRVRRALRRARRLGHPALCGVRAVVRDAGRHVAVVERPFSGEGGDVEPLSARLRGGPLSLEDTRALAAALCGALAHAHEHGLVHAHLDAASVVATPDGWVLADLPQALTRPGEHDDERVDVRAVGAVLYEALTGRPPFEVPALSLPPEVRPQILRCLQHDPGRRYGRVLDLAAALRVPVVAAPSPPRPTWRRVTAAIVLVAVVGVGAAAARRFVDGAPPPATPATVAAPSPPPAPAPARKRPLLVVSPFEVPVDDPEVAWLRRGLAEAFLVLLDETSGAEVLRGPVEAGTLREATRNAGLALVLDGRVERAGDGLAVGVRLYDAGKGAYALAERVVVPRVDDLIARLDEVAAQVWRLADVAARGAPPAPGERAPTRSLAALATKSARAFRAYVEGLDAAAAGSAVDAEAAYRRAIALDASFFHPRARLSELLAAAGRRAEAEQAADAARPLAARAGAWGALTMRRLDARTPDERIAALVAARDRTPRDVTVAVQLARAFRAAGRPAECAAEADRAVAQGASPGEDLAWCRLASGDAAGALTAARKATGPDAALLVGDLTLMHGRYGEARDAYRRAHEATRPGAAARRVLLELVARGRCRTTVRPDTEEDVRVWAAAAIACGDWAGAREAELWARRNLPGGRVADELAVLAAAARGARGAWARAMRRAENPSLWSAEGLDRARRWGPVLAAARAEGKEAESVALLATLPADRVALFEPPLLFELALTKLEGGDLDEAELACTELASAAPAWIPAIFCRARVAEAREAWSAAFAAYREFLDRWAGADHEHRLVREATRRIKRVIARARAARASGEGAGPAR